MHSNSLQAIIYLTSLKSGVPFLVFLDFLAEKGEVAVTDNIEFTLVLTEREFSSLFPQFSKLCVLGKLFQSFLRF